jgi:nickel/cobalt transporter (NiCoT) family protein
MLTVLHHRPDRPALSVRSRILLIYAILALVNLIAWLWAALVFRSHAVLLGDAMLAYGFGLRHAVDADHIAAIDNVTRKLMQDRKRPVTTGFWFALGHSTIVILAAAAVALTASAIRPRLNTLQGIGGIVSTGSAAFFLFAIAAMNLVILRSVWRTLRNVRNGAPYADEDFDLLLNGRGLMSRVFRPLFRLIGESWHMFPLGFLFGLGFDTATEIALLGISGAEAAKGLSIWSIMVFPVLFTAGMALIDTSDGVLMMGVYQWAFVKPIRKLYYNLTITAVSVVVAVLIGGIEALRLAGEQFGFSGGF